MKRRVILGLILAVVLSGSLILADIPRSRQAFAWPAHIWGAKYFLGRQQGMSVNFSRAEIHTLGFAFLTLHTMWANTSPIDNYWVEVGYMDAIPALVAGTDRPWDFAVRTWYYWTEATVDPENWDKIRFSTHFVQLVGNEYPWLHAGTYHATGDHKWSVYLLNLDTYEYIIPKSNLTDWSHGPYADYGGSYGGETYDTLSWFNRVWQTGHNYLQVYPPYQWHLIPNDDGEIQDPPFEVAWIDPPQGEDYRLACVSLNSRDGDCPPD